MNVRPASTPCSDEREADAGKMNVAGLAIGDYLPFLGLALVYLA